MPATSTLRAQLAGQVHNESWASNTELNISTENSDSSQNIPQHVYVSVLQRDFIVSQSIANCKQLNPGFTFHVMDDVDIQHFVEQKAPTLLPIFSQLQGVERSDFWRAVEHYLALFDEYSLDVATGHHAEIVGDVGVFPKFALASPYLSRAVYSQVYVKHMFAGSWKDTN
ncbi:hypothetical protein WJX79_011140 [Trebouxia sp. C0005]